MEKTTKDSNILAQASILMIAGIIVRIISVLYRSPVTSIIGDEGNGYYSIAMNIYTMLLLISSYSIPMAVSKVVSGKMALKQYRDAYKVFKCALIYVLIVGGIAALITFFGASVLIPSSQSNAVPALKVLAPAIFMSGFLGVLRGFFQSQGTMIPTSVSQIIEQIFNAIVSIGAALLFISLFSGNSEAKRPVYGAMGSATGTMAGVAAGLVFMIILYRLNRNNFMRKVRRDHSNVDSSYGEIFKVIFLMVTPVILSTFVYNISSVIDQTFFVRAMDHKGMASELSASLYGVFSGKYWVLINVPVAFANSMSTAMIPAVSGSYTLKEYDECRGHIRNAVKFTMLISIPSAVGLGVLARPIMELLFPQKATIDLAVAILRTGCISVIFYSFSTVSNGVLQGIGKVNIPLRNAACALLIHIAALVPLLYFTDLNLYALVFATMIYSFLMCLFNNLSVYKYLGYRQEYKKAFFMPAVSAVVMGVFCYIFYEGIYFIVSSIFGFLLPIRVMILICILIAVAFAVAVYFVISVKIKAVTEEELKNFPKGNALVRLGYKLNLFEKREK